MRRIDILTFALLFCFALTTSPQVQPQTRIFTFDVPVADEQYPQRGTFPCCINSAGAIAGTYIDVNGLRHGFVRRPDGHISTFDYPNSIQISAIHGINDFGLIVGEYVDTSGYIHAFLRTPDGDMTGFDGPGVGPYTWLGTQARSINLFGVIAGDYWDENMIAHGLVRTPDGKITVIDAPGAGSTVAYEGTYINTINMLGALSGGFVDYVDQVGWIGHQFVRTPRGTYEVYNDTPHATPGGTYSTCLNAAGAVAGDYLDANNLAHGFLRTPAGKITEFDPPNAAVGTYTDGINLVGVIVGFYGDQKSVWHGYLRTPGGRFVTFDAPGAGTAPGQGTGASCAGIISQFVSCVSINSHGEVAGGYLDEQNVSHGFIRLPQIGDQENTQ